MSVITLKSTDTITGNDSRSTQTRKAGTVRQLLPLLRHQLLTLTEAALLSDGYHAYNITAADEIRQFWRSEFEHIPAFILPTKF